MLCCAFVFSEESEDKCALMQNMTEDKILVMNLGFFCLG